MNWKWIEYNQEVNRKLIQKFNGKWIGTGWEMNRNCNRKWIGNWMGYENEWKINRINRSWKGNDRNMMENEDEMKRKPIRHAERIDRKQTKIDRKWIENWLIMNGDDDDDDCYYVNLEPLARPPYTNPLHKPLTQTLLHKPLQKRFSKVCVEVSARFVRDLIAGI